MPSYPNFAVLLVDDEPSFTRSLSLSLERQGGINHLLKCNDSRQVMALLDQQPIGLVLLDLTMPHISGEELLLQIAEQHPDVVVIIASGLNQLDTAVKCMRLGAFDYIVKTADISAYLASINKAINQIETRQQTDKLKDKLLHNALDRPEAFAAIVTQDAAMLAIFQYLETIADSRQPVMLQGESGVGKELFAHAVHKVCNRKGPMVSVNIAGLDDHMFSDTLFGHTRGAFTGAEKARAGMIEQAAGGTLFLDEIGDLDPSSQVKLLRLLQEGEYYPLGSDRPKRIDAKIVVATHQDLNQLQQQGKFRRDLYYRLMTHRVEIPPLRQRSGDIPMLVNYFADTISQEMARDKPTISSDALQLLAGYSFPGNVRELRALLYDAISRSGSEGLTAATFQEYQLQSSPNQLASVSHDDLLTRCHALPTLQQIGDLLVNEAMRRSNGNQSMAAKMLGISQPALSKRLKKQSEAPL